MPDFLRVKADGANVSVTTDVKDLININVIPEQNKRNTELIDIVKIVPGSTFLTTLYFDIKGNSYVKPDKTQDVVTKYIDISGNYYIKI